ncbi:MAG: HAMP domain-containing histidine kinase [Arcobacteraceae bacterium]|nr:HAMP domain-containing histidine kinase [Arcobacteraceae bacterium]MDY0328602.1 HAMP domain-containing sensor histidine kinase [Arcobacteraceae bacterium]
MVKYSISRKLILILIFALILVFLVRVPINYYSSHDTYNLERTQKAQLLEKRLKLGIASPIWNLHYDLVKNIIDIEVQDPYVSSIIITDIDGAIISIAKHNGVDIHDNQTSTFQVYFMDEHIANVKIIFDERIMNDKLWNNFMAFTLQFLVVLIFVSIVFKLSLDSFVIKNLKILKKSISEIRKNKKYNQKIVIDTNDEFKLLADEFNEMQDTINSTLEDLESLNNDLEKRIQFEVEKNSKREKEIYNQSKFLQMGEMLSNIAHHWRQPLSAISTTASGLKIQKEFGMLDDKDFINSIDTIMTQTKKLSSTIDDFRKFFIEEHSENKTNFDINETISKLSTIIVATLDEKNITLDTSLEQNLLIYGYQNEIFQVLLNLLNNAIEAFENKQIDYNKKIKITTYKKDSDIQIEIEDNAGGIPEQYIEKIFDPYFTTKHQKQGVGVSLYMCKEMIYKHHNGNIIVSNSQNGAKFTIIIPTI